jgi:hypothetical protein
MLLKNSSIDFSGLEIQSSDNPAKPFSFLHSEVALKDSLVNCWGTKTNRLTHQIIQDHFHLIPEFQGKAPRYCPSIELKGKTHWLFGWLVVVCLFVCLLHTGKMSAMNLVNIRSVLFDSETME